MAEKKRRVAGREDCTLQLRAPLETRDQLQEMAAARGMVMKDMLARIVSFFMQVDPDLQSIILGQIYSDEARDRIIEVLSRTKPQGRVLTSGARRDDRAAHNRSRGGSQSPHAARKDTA